MASTSSESVSLKNSGLFCQSSNRDFASFEASNSKLSSRQWYRCFSDVYNSWYYWDASTGTSTWDLPPVGDVIIDHTTQRPLQRETCLSSSRPDVSSQDSSSSSVHSARALSLSSSRSTSTSVPSPFQNGATLDFQVKRQTSPEILLQIEENDRKLAEQLQSEMDEEYRLTVINMPKPSEVLGLLKDRKRNNPTVKNNNKSVVSSESKEDLVREMEKSGIPVRLMKRKNKK